MESKFSNALNAPGNNEDIEEDIKYDEKFESGDIKEENENEDFVESISNFLIKNIYSK